MKKGVEKDSFENIRRYVKISFFVSSIIPLGLLTYITLRYFYPSLELPFYLIVLLTLAVLISVLGLFLLTETTNSSILSLQGLYEKLNNIIKITKQFRTTPYLDILLEDIINSAKHINSTEVASLLLFDEAGNLTFKVLSGQKGQTLKDRIIKRGQGISGWVAEKGEPLLINDVTKDQRFNPDFDKETGFKTKSVLCVPLIYRNEIIGAIEVLNKKDGPFTEEDEKLLYNLADQAAISIAHNRLHENQKSDLIHITEILVKAQDYRFPEKKGHVRRVANYAGLIGRNMSLAETDLKTLYYASLLHDIGFLVTEITDQGYKGPWEKKRYIQHPKLGYEMIKSINMWKGAADIILSHHERYDGTGYPSGEKGEDIPLGSRILFIAEVFDVLTSKSSYRDRLDYNAAISEIEAHSGTQFDPEVVKALKSSIKNSDLVE